MRLPGCLAGNQNLSPQWERLMVDGIELLRSILERNRSVLFHIGEGDQTHTKPDQRHTESDQIKKCGGRSPLVALGCASQKIGGHFWRFFAKLYRFFTVSLPVLAIFQR